VDLNLLLSQFLPILKRRAGPSIAVEAVLEPELGQIRGDTGQLKQIVLNLVLNARDRMPLGGSVRIVTGNVELPARAPHYAGSESFIRLAIEGARASKTGEAGEPKLEPLFAGNKPAMGLGLAVVDAMVNAADGLICADGQPDGGSRFEIFLPRWREPEKSDDIISPPSAAEPGRQKRMHKRGDKTS
jgi:two-component system cell cycle sensor histidine kinase/response regulator CckA